jgi:hypothetical protein
MTKPKTHLNHPAIARAACRRRSQNLTDNPSEVTCEMCRASTYMLKHYPDCHAPSKAGRSRVNSIRLVLSGLSDDAMAWCQEGGAQAIVGLIEREVREKE